MPDTSAAWCGITNIVPIINSNLAQYVKSWAVVTSHEQQAQKAVACLQKFKSGFKQPTPSWFLLAKQRQPLFCNRKQAEIGIFLFFQPSQYVVQAPFNILTFTHSQTHGINYSGFIGVDVLIFGFCLGVQGTIWKRQWCNDSFNSHYVPSYNGVLDSRVISQNVIWNWLLMAAVWF